MMLGESLSEIADRALGKYVQFDEIIGLLSYVAAQGKYSIEYKVESDISGKNALDQLTRERLRKEGIGIEWKGRYAGVNEFIIFFKNG